MGGDQASAAANEASRATIAAGLQASGQCPAIWSVVPDIMDLLNPVIPKVAATTQAQREDPAENQTACENVVSKHVDKIIDDNLQEGQGRGTGQVLRFERQAAKWAASDAGWKVCDGLLKKTLQENSDIRKKQPSEYRSAIEKRLL